MGVRGMAWCHAIQKSRKVKNAQNRYQSFARYRADRGLWHRCGAKPQPIPGQAHHHDCSISARRRDRPGGAGVGQALERWLGTARRGGQPCRCRWQYRHCGFGQSSARWLHPGGDDGQRHVHWAPHPQVLELCAVQRLHADHQHCQHPWRCFGRHQDTVQLASRHGEGGQSPAWKNQLCECGPGVLAAFDCRKTVF